MDGIVIGAGMDGGVGKDRDVLVGVGVKALFPSATGQDRLDHAMGQEHAIDRPRRTGQNRQRATPRHPDASGVAPAGNSGTASRMKISPPANSVAMPAMA